MAKKGPIAKFAAASKDFKKKKAKVGKKLAAANETKVRLQSKKIFLPDQLQAKKALNHQGDSQGSNTDNSTREYVAHLTKQLKHHSANHRIQALHEVKSFCFSNDSADKHLALLYPDMIELLFKEDSETRDTMVETFKALVEKFQVSSFTSVLPLLITYISSALSNLDKAIRRDAMLILTVLAEKSPESLFPYLPKIMKNVLAVLQDRTLSMNASAVATNSNISAMSLPNGSNSKDSRRTTVKKNDDDSNRSARISLFMLSLRLSALLLSSTCQDTDNATLNNEEALSSLSPGTVLLMGPTWNKTLSTVSNLPSSSATSKSIFGMEMSLVEGVMSRMEDIWNNLINLEGSVLSSSTTDILLKVISVAKAVVVQAVKDTESFDQLSSRTLEFVNSMFAQFPFSSKEASVARPGSAVESRGHHQIGLLNVELCKLSLLLPALESADRRNREVGQYLLDMMTDKLDGNSRQAAVEDSSLDIDLLEKILSCYELAASFVQSAVIKDTSSASSSGAVKFLDRINHFIVLHHFPSASEESKPIKANGAIQSLLLTALQAQLTLVNGLASLQQQIAPETSDLLLKSVCLSSHLIISLSPSWPVILDYLHAWRQVLTSIDRDLDEDILTLMRTSYTKLLSYLFSVHQLQEISQEIKLRALDVLYYMPVQLNVIFWDVLGSLLAWVNAGANNEVVGYLLTIVACKADHLDASRLIDYVLNELLPGHVSSILSSFKGDTNRVSLVRHYSTGRQLGHEVAEFLVQLISDRYQQSTELGVASLGHLSSALKDSIAAAAPAAPADSSLSRYMDGIEKVAILTKVSSSIHEDSDSGGQELNVLRTLQSMTVSVIAELIGSIAPSLVKQLSKEEILVGYDAEGLEMLLEETVLQPVCSLVCSKKELLSQVLRTLAASATKEDAINGVRVMLRSIAVLTGGVCPRDVKEVLVTWISDIKATVESSSGTHDLVKQCADLAACL